MRKCGLYRRQFKKLNQCWILKERLHGWRANPNYWHVSGFRTLYLCDDCSYISYTLKNTQAKVTPIILEEDYFKGR